MSMSMLSYLTSFVTPRALIALETVLSLVLANFVLGVFVALKQGQFAWGKLAQYVQTSLVPYVGGLLVLSLFSNSNTELATVFFTVAGTIAAKFLADVLTKVSQLFGGINIQIQSPIKLDKGKSAPAPQGDVSPQTDAATTTPAVAKTIPAEPTQIIQPQAPTQV